MGIDLEGMSFRFGVGALLLLGAVVGYCLIVRWLRARYGPTLRWLGPLGAALVMGLFAAPELGALLVAGPESLGTSGLFGLSFGGLAVGGLLGIVLFLPAFLIATCILLRVPASERALPTIGSLLLSVVGWFSGFAMTILALFVLL